MVKKWSVYVVVLPIYHSAFYPYKTPYFDDSGFGDNGWVIVYSGSGINIFPRSGPTIEKHNRWDFKVYKHNPWKVVIPLIHLFACPSAASRSMFYEWMCVVTRMSCSLQSSRVVAKAFADSPNGKWTVYLWTPNGPLANGWTVNFPITSLGLTTVDSTTRRFMRGNFISFWNVSCTIPPPTFRKSLRRMFSVTIRKIRVEIVN